MREARNWNKSKGLSHKRTNIPPHHQLHKSIRNLTSGTACFSSRLLSLSPPRSTFIFFVPRSPVLPITSKSSTLSHHHPPPPASRAKGCRDSGSSKASCQERRRRGGSRPLTAPAPGLLLPDCRRGPPQRGFRAPGEAPTRASERRQ